MSATVSTSLRLPRDLHERLQAEAARQRRTVHNLMLLLIERGLSEAEQSPAARPGAQ